MSRWVANEYKTRRRGGGLYAPRRSKSVLKGWKHEVMIRSADGTYKKCLPDGTTKEFGRSLTKNEEDVLIAAMIETEQAGLTGAAKKQAIDDRMKAIGSEARWGENIMDVYQRPLPQT